MYKNKEKLVTFRDLNLSSEILRAINELGFTIPTKIQELIIPGFIQTKRDIIGLAQTGTGKTAAFGIPLLEKTKTDENTVQSLVLCPTRELCVQITAALESYAKYIRPISITSVYGGANIEPQIRSLKRGTHIIVATPGRLLDLMRRKAADMQFVRYLVLDEADIMLNMGFKEELDAILESLPKDRQTSLFSATMPGEVSNMISDYMTDPEEIVIGEKNSGVDTVEHKFYTVRSHEKYQALKRLIDFNPGMYGIVFCRTKNGTREVAEKLINDGYSTEALHGDLSQGQRETAMSKFRSKNISLLIATDIASRGLDVNDLTHIIHYDLPHEREIYTHRSGRTGRAGKNGVSMAITTRKDAHKIRMFEKTVRRQIRETTVPKGSDICSRQLLNTVEKIQTAEVDEDQIAPFLPMIEEKLAGLDREILIKRFVSLEFNKFLRYYSEKTDIKEEKSGKPVMSRSKKLPKRNTKYRSITINLGKRDRILPQQMIGLINERTRIRNIRIGKIDIGTSESQIQIESGYVSEVCRSLYGHSYRGRKLAVQAEKKP